MNFTLTLQVYEEEGGFVGYCRELGTSTCGDTPDETRQLLLEAVELHIEALEEDGELERVLEERRARPSDQGGGAGDDINCVTWQGSLSVVEAEAERQDAGSSRHFVLV